MRASISYVKRALVKALPLLIALFPFITNAYVVYSNPYVTIENDGSVSDIGGSGFNTCLYSQDNPAPGQTALSCGAVASPVSYPYTKVLDAYLTNIHNYNYATSSVSTTTKMCWSANGGGACSPDVSVVITSGVLTSVNGAAIGIDWNNYYVPTIFSSSSVGIATSSSLWGSVSIASSSVNCDGGNFFSDALCSVGSYLFVPNPDIVNGLIQTVNGSVQKFPFSWVYGMQNAFQSLSATGTGMTAFSINWSAMNVGTSTPLGLANIAPASTTVLSQTTIEHYISPSTWSLFQTLIALGIWLVFIADVFFTTRNQMHKV